MWVIGNGHRPTLVDSNVKTLRVRSLTLTCFLKIYFTNTNLLYKPIVPKRTILVKIKMIIYEKVIQNSITFKLFMKCMLCL